MEPKRLKIIDLKFCKRRFSFLRFFALIFVINIIFSAVPASASEGDISIFQRGGTTYHRGNLSRDPRFPTYSLGFSHAFYTNIGKSGLELSNVITASHSMFYTLKTPELMFPLVAKAPHQMFEPAFLMSACFFVYTRVRPCFGVGVSSVYLRYNAQNYLMLSGFPGQARLQIILPSGVFIEGGATIRRFSMRREGELAWSQDITGFFGLGLLFMSQF